MYSLKKIAKITICTMLVASILTSCISDKVAEEKEELNSSETSSVASANPEKASSESKVSSSSSEVSSSSKNAASSSKASSVSSKTTSSSTKKTTKKTKKTFVIPTDPETGERHSPNVKYHIKKSAAVDPSYFDDVVFIGDSISNMFKICELSDNALGNAEFLCATSLSPYNALWDIDAPNNKHPIYKGKKVRIPEGVKLTGRKKVYIMLGSNGVGGGRSQPNIECLKQLVDQIKALVPDATFFMQSLTPVTTKCKNPKQTDVNKFNADLSKACKKYGWYFIDTAASLYGKDGYLPMKWCAEWDPQYMHVNQTGYKHWAKYILTHVPEECKPQATKPQKNTK